MITLITGTPGAGKTALAVSMLLSEAGNRPVFISGIPNLKLDHQLTPPVDEWTIDVPSQEDANIKRPEFTFPANSIIVIDESQNVFRPRAATSKVPPYIAAFETHRHTGVDFWLITQHPGLIDSNIRKLVGRHVHIRNTPFGRYLYEWPEVGEPESKSSRQISASRRYKLPKKVFGLYKSATVHTKQRVRMPVAVYVLVVALIAVIAGGWYWAVRIKQIQGGDPDIDPVHTSPINPQNYADSSKSPSDKKPITVDEYLAMQSPRIAGLLHTAPAYDELTKPSRVPVPAACVATKARCKCYTQDATPYMMDDSVCRQIVSGGTFLAFLPEGKTDPARQRDASPASGPLSRVDTSNPTRADTSLPYSGDFVGVSSRTVDQVSALSDRTYAESVPGDKQTPSHRYPSR